MILVRDVFQARYGQGDALVRLLKGNDVKPPALIEGGRILTDLSGPYFTVILETEHASMGAWESQVSQLFADPRFAPWFERMTALVESGRREFFTIA